MTLIHVRNGLKDLKLGSYESLAVGFFAQLNYLIPNSNLRIRLTASKPQFGCATQVINRKFQVSKFKSDEL